MPIAKYRMLFIPVLLALAIAFSLPVGTPVSAQQNLLTNPGFEQTDGNYRPFGRSDFTFAPGWGGWWTDAPRTEDWMNREPIAYPHSGFYKREGNFSQNVGRGHATFTAATYQIVGDIPEGSRLRFSAWVFQENVSESGAQTRVGIGSNVSSNPLASNITWSPWSRTVQQWEQISVEAVVPAGTVTVFIYSTQTWPNNANQMFYDDASLVIVGTGEAPPQLSPGGDVAVPAPTTAPAVAPFVNPQRPQDDGTIVHIVAEGDTLAAIAVAYGVPASEIAEINNLGGGFLQIGQRLIIREGSPEPPTTAPEVEPAIPVLSGSMQIRRPRTIAPPPTQIPQSSSAAPPSVAVQPTPEPPPPQPTVAEVEPAQPTVSEVEPAEPVEIAQVPPADAEQPAEPVEPEPPQDTPVPTPVPATPTPAPTAPVTTGIEADPASVEAAVCVLMFEDVDQNRIQGPAEMPLSGGTIILNDADAAEVSRHETTSSPEPYCFEELAPGRYTAIATPPEGYGLTTPASLVVSVQPGTRFQISFGAAAGVSVAAVPTPDGVALASDNPGDADDTAGPQADIRDFVGIIVLGMAGFVLVGGAALAVVARRL